VGKRSGVGDALGTSSRAVARALQKGSKEGETEQYILQTEVRVESRGLKGQKARKKN